MEDIEYKLNKILKLYRQFEHDQSIEIAEDVEMNIDMLKALIGERFYELTFFVRIANKVTNFLNSLEKKGAAE